MIAFATREQLAELDPFPDGLPDNADRLLRAATLLVRSATRFDRYDTDPAGRPTEPEVIDALAEATCWQALTWIEADVDPAVTIPPEQRVSGSSIDGASVAYDTALAASELHNLLHHLCGNARLVLEDAGLGGREVAAW